MHFSQTYCVLMYNIKVHSYYVATYVYFNSLWVNEWIATDVVAKIKHLVRFMHS